MSFFGRFGGASSIMSCFSNRAYDIGNSADAEQRIRSSSKGSPGEPFRKLPEFWVQSWLFRVIL
jgi:hypothetical protein